MGITPPLEPESPPNYLLPSEAVLHPNMVDFIRFQLRNSHDAVHIITHFHEHWHREIALEDIEAISTETFIP